MKLIFSLLLLITFHMNAQTTQQAIDFSAITIDGKPFKLSDLKGKKILLSFFRNGACALCNLRVHELSQHQQDFDRAGIAVIAVFESPIEDMKPYVGKQKLSFTLLSDPTGKLYELYGIKNSPEIINDVMASGSAHDRVAQAAEAGFVLTKQERTNFYRIPAEVLINEDFTIERVHHCEKLVDHLPIAEILQF